MLVCPFLRKDYMYDTRAHMNHFGSVMNKIGYLERLHEAVL
jgi:hypothetical protein